MNHINAKAEKLDKEKIKANIVMMGTNIGEQNINNLKNILENFIKEEI